MISLYDRLKKGKVVVVDIETSGLFCGEEEKIRRNLIEKNNIDAIIGLSANIFFGTGIPTTTMVLKKGTSRNDLDDILIIDASKEYEKDGKNNKLRERDIKKIADT